MPLPTPHDGEKEDVFIARCMSSEAVKEFSEEKQKLAVCYSQFKKRDSEASGRMTIQAAVEFSDLE